MLALAPWEQRRVILQTKFHSHSVSVANAIQCWDTRKRLTHRDKPKGSNTGKSNRGTVLYCVFWLCFWWLQYILSVVKTDVAKQSRNHRFSMDITSCIWIIYCWQKNPQWNIKTVCHYCNCHEHRASSCKEWILTSSLHHYQALPLLFFSHVNFCSSHHLHFLSSPTLIIQLEPVTHLPFFLHLPFFFYCQFIVWVGLLSHCFTRWPCIWIMSVSTVVRV